MRFWLCMPLILAVFLAGCDGGSKKTTQVAARVNGAEITIHQINSVLARTANAGQANAERVKREILERLVNQELAKQQAIEKKLDRTPAVVQAIEAAKNDILARAYFEQVATSLPKPTADDVKKYYAEHPELFSQRRIYHVEEILVRSAEGLPRDLREQLARSKSIAALAAWLKARQAQFIQNERVLAAEEVPLAALRALQKAREGEIQINEAPDRISIYRVISSRPAPVDEAVATPRIQQFLFSQRMNEAVAKEVKRLRSLAKVEFLGEFAAGESPAQSAKAAATPATLPPPAAETPAAPSSPTAPVSDTPDFEKGLRGLK